MKRFILVILLCLIPSMAMSEKTNKEIKFKAGINTAQEKIEYLYIAQEALRLEHNAKGKDFRDGIMTESEWKLWQDEYFIVRADAISMELIKAKDELKQSKKYTADLENDFEDKAN